MGRLRILCFPRAPTAAAAGARAILPVCVALGILAGCYGGGGDEGNLNQNQNRNTNFAWVCGNGRLDLGEECDEGPDNSDTRPDACRADCRDPRCGDGVVDTGEACDDGNQKDCDGCRGDCSGVETGCGDGYVCGIEECDDGNGDNSDECPETCVVAYCGDGFVRAGVEECDDGNQSDEDGCLSTCVAARCGDGILQVGVEACDDGNTEDCDGCRGDCSAEETGCGDGFLCGAEQCDGGAGTLDCTSIAPVFQGGSLGCTGDCRWDTGACTLTSGLPWVCITGDIYRMGGTNSDEQPLHTVLIASFEMTASEVTASQYEQCVLEGACTAPGTGGRCNYGAPSYREHPVNCVDWYQAVAFCAWAGGRLPSEAEWEFAARSGGQVIEYPWGDDEATCALAVMSEGVSGCGAGSTWRVCTRPAGSSAQRLCDLAGNVWEWVEDDYHLDYTGAPIYGGPWVDSPRAPSRVVRGGSLLNNAHTLRSASRFYLDPADRFPYLGFRCVR